MDKIQYPNSKSTQISIFLEFLIKSEAYSVIKSEFIKLMNLDIGIESIQVFTLLCKNLKTTELDTVEMSLIRLHDDFKDVVSIEKQNKKIDSLKNTNQYRNNIEFGKPNYKTKEMVDMAQNLVENAGIIDKVNILKTLWAIVFQVTESNNTKILLLSSHDEKVTEINNNIIELETKISKLQESIQEFEKYNYRKSWIHIFYLNVAVDIAILFLYHHQLLNKVLNLII